MKQTIEQLIYLAERVREVMTNAPYSGTLQTVTPIIKYAENGYVYLTTSKFEEGGQMIIMYKGKIEFPVIALDYLQEWADLATDEFNANEGRLRKRNSEWLAAKIKNAEKELQSMKEFAI